LIISIGNHLPIDLDPVVIRFTATNPIGEDQIDGQIGEWAGNSPNPFDLAPVAIQKNSLHLPPGGIRTAPEVNSFRGDPAHHWA